MVGNGTLLVLKTVTAHAGRVSVNVAPLPGFERTLISPLWFGSPCNNGVAAWGRLAP